MYRTIGCSGILGADAALPIVATAGVGVGDAAGVIVGGVDSAGGVTEVDDDNDDDDVDDDDVDDGIESALQRVQLGRTIYLVLR